MPTCSFCKQNYEAPRGLTVFLNDGKTVHFCSSKCRRNKALKRDPRKTKWVKKTKKPKKELKAEKPKKQGTDEPNKEVAEQKQKVQANK